MPVAAKLARKLYSDRIGELKSLIGEEEQRFRKVVAEIDEIRSGKRDDELREILKEQNREKDHTPNVLEATTKTNATVAKGIAGKSDAIKSSVARTTTTKHARSPRLASLPTTSIHTFRSTRDKQAGASADKASAMEIDQTAATSQAKSTTSLRSTTSHSSSPKKGSRLDSMDINQTSATIEQSSQLASEKIGKDLVASGSSVKPVDHMDIDPKFTEDNFDIPDNVTPQEPNVTELEPLKHEALRRIMKVTSPSQTELENDSPRTVAEDLAMDIDEQMGETNRDVAETSPRVHFAEAGLGSSSHPTVGERMEYDDDTTPGNGGQSDIEASNTSPTAVMQAGASMDTSTREETSDDDDVRMVHVSSDDEDAKEATMSKDHEHELELASREMKETPTSAGRAPSTPGDGASEITNVTPGAETSEGAGSMADKRHKTWQRLVYMILTDIGNHRFASVFQNPIKEQDAPGYYSIVKQPMDLKTIRKRLRDLVVTTTDEFHRDVMLMFMNALMYNREETHIYQVAMQMKDEVDQMILEFKRSESARSGSFETTTRRKSVATEPTSRIPLT